MKISKQKLKKIIAEEIANVEEGLFGTGFWKGAGGDRLKDRRRPSGKPASAGADFDTKDLESKDSSEDMDTFGGGLSRDGERTFNAAGSYSDFKDQKQDQKSAEANRTQDARAKAQDAHINQSDDALYAKIQRLEKIIDDMEKRGLPSEDVRLADKESEVVKKDFGSHIESMSDKEIINLMRDEGAQKDLMKNYSDSLAGKELDFKTSLSKVIGSGKYRELRKDMARLARKGRKDRERERRRVKEEVRKAARHMIKEELRKILRHKR